MSMPRYIWGVDSAATVNDELYSCVKSNFGTPRYWGRYLTEVPNVSEGLTKREIAFIQSKGMKLLPIYNVFSEALGYSKGQVAARNAVFHSRRLGIPNNVAIFANVERFFEVDEAWIRGWVEALYPTGYRPGIYHDPTEGPFAVEYCKAVAGNNQVAVQTILWSAEPEPGPTKDRNAPAFKPAKPNCQGNAWLWQYGRDATECPIDTNLADSRVLQYLY